MSTDNTAYKRYLETQDLWYRSEKKYPDWEYIRGSSFCAVRGVAHRKED